MIIAAIQEEEEEETRNYNIQFLPLSCIRNLSELFLHQINNNN